MSKISSLRGRFYINHILSIILIVLFSCFIFFCMANFSQVSTSTFYENCISSPLTILLNLAPILLTMLFIYGLTAHCAFSIASTSSLFLLMGLINNLKIFYRNDPFIISDFGLARELIGILGDFNTTLLYAGIFSLIVLVLFFIFLLYVFRPAKLKWWKRLIVCIGCILVGVLLYFSLYKDDNLYNGLTVDGNIYCKYDQYSSKGWLYCFIYEADTLLIKPPEDYKASDFSAEEATAEASEYSNAVKPQIVMIMSEAFSDLSINSAFDFSGYRDPLENYKKIREDAVVSGHVAVDVFGGGTATTEFEVLTGIDADSFSNSTSPYNLIRKDFYGLPFIMKDLSYDTVAIHPGDGWFYNRDNVYPYLGFDKFLRLDNGIDSDPETKGGYVSEAVTYDYLLEELSPYLRGENGSLFEFCVTIQNHGGYSMKYGDLDPNFDSAVNFSDTAKNQLTNYFHGVIDADIELGQFIDELEHSEEPVIVVYWGDHYPSFNDVYDKIGYGYKYGDYEYTEMDMYDTPFFVWQNSAAAEVTSLSENAAALGLGNNELFNASFLGSTLLQLLNVQEMSPFMSFTNDVRNAIPVKNVFGFIDGAGAVLKTLPSNLSEIDKKYDNWSYYLMFDQ